MWGAHQADGRIAAKNATKIRAALQNAIDAKRVFEQYLTTNPAVSDNQAQDKARARSWALLNLRINNEALKKALLRLYAEAWVMGDLSAQEAILRAEELKKADNLAIVDWDTWQPGDEATALLLNPPKAFETLVTGSGALITGLDKTGYELIGSALAESIRLGLSPTRAAKIINNQIGNPARALTIAITETSRVMNSAAKARYLEAGLQQNEWNAVTSVAGGSVACDKCAGNTGQVVNIGSYFNSGQTQPPAHPHCRCFLTPVIPDYANMPNAQGVVDIAPQAKPSIATESTITPKLPTSIANTKELKSGEINSFIEGQKKAGWNDLDQPLFKQAVRNYVGGGYNYINNELRVGATRSAFLDKIRPEILGQIKILDKIIENAKPTPKPIVVFRGIYGRHAEIIKKLKKGDWYEDKGFVSTSLKRAVAEKDFAIEGGDVGVIIEIFVPQGSKTLIPLAYQANPGGIQPYELEVILPRGSKFRVVSTSGNVIKVALNE